MNEKITNAINEGNELYHYNLKIKSDLIKSEKERLLENDYIYKKVRDAVANNKNYFEMYNDTLEITKDAINEIEGMKAIITYGHLRVYFPNKIKVKQ